MSSDLFYSITKLSCMVSTFYLRYSKSPEQTATRELRHRTPKWTWRVGRCSPDGVQRTGRTTCRTGDNDRTGTSRSHRGDQQGTSVQGGTDAGGSREWTETITGTYWAFILGNNEGVKRSWSHLRSMQIFTYGTLLGGDYQILAWSHLWKSIGNINLEGNSGSWK